MPTRADAEVPLLVCDRARISMDDSVAIHELSLVSKGDRVVVAGDMTVLFAALSSVPLLAAAPTTAPIDEIAPMGEARITAGRCAWTATMWPSKRTSPQPDSRRSIRLCRAR
ncbi:MAG: hypothetical protein IPK82_24235 [Polyangiaceae bacterium]|nr:hypothetical protein [Polyangiaceae bacterium]